MTAVGAVLWGSFEHAEPWDCSRVASMHKPPAVFKASQIGMSMTTSCFCMLVEPGIVTPSPFRRCLPAAMRAGPDSSSDGSEVSVAVQMTHVVEEVNSHLPGLPNQRITQGQL